MATLLALANGLRFKTTPPPPRRQTEGLQGSMAASIETQVDSITQGEETKYIAVLLAKFIGNYGLATDQNTSDGEETSRWTQVMNQMLVYPNNESKNDEKF